MMKKGIIIGLAVLMVCGMTACSSDKKTAADTEVTTVAVTTEATTEAATEAATEATTEATTEAVTETAGEETNTISGEVVDAAMSTVAILTEDGTKLIFSREEAESDLKYGLDIGVQVTLEYTGTINGTDTTGATVLKITDAIAE